MATSTIAELELSARRLDIPVLIHTSEHHAAIEYSIRLQTYETLDLMVPSTLKLWPSDLIAKAAELASEHPRINASIDHWFLLILLIFHFLK